MAHLLHITAPRPADEQAPAYHGPMPAVTTNPKQDFVQAVRLAFQNYRQEKRIS